MFRTACLWLLLLFTAACASQKGTLEARFGREESCKGAVSLRPSGNNHVLAEGCGKKVDYVCEGYPPANARTQCQRAGLPPPPGSAVGDPPRFPARAVDDAPGRHP